MERFIATAIRLVRIEPEAPTIMPATIIAVLFSAKPAAAADNPVIAFSSEMTTGMSAPPIGNTTNSPMMPASTRSNTIHQTDSPLVQSDEHGCGDGGEQQHDVGGLEQQAFLTNAFSTPCQNDVFRSLANATSEPQNDTEPMTAANSDPTTRATVGDWSALKCENPFVSMNSAQAMSATVPPPTPLNKATSCGIAVILVFWLGAREDHADRQAGDDQDPVDRRGVANPDQVAITAMAMPVAAIQLPRTAVLGPVRPIRP